MPERDAKGHFVKGNKGGPGRPALSAELPITEGIKAAASAERVACLLEKLYSDGMNGDMRAATIWLGYVLGKPKESLDLSVGLRSLSDDELRRLAAGKH